MNADNWYVVGVDPAPTKDAVICHGSGVFDVMPPGSLRAWLRELLDGYENVLVAWDAPLSFDPTDFYDRRIDKVIRWWIAGLIQQGSVATKAVNARSFAGLPHWAVSCYVVGYPFCGDSRSMELVAQPREGHCIVEVHPAVALAAWWADLKPGFPLERYKGKRSTAAKIAEALGFPSIAGKDDDHLDAYAAYKLGSLLLTGEARLVGSVAGGGYVLPNGPACREIDALLKR